MSDLSTLEALGIVVGGLCAVGGLVLGIVNAYTQHSRAKPRLVVRPGVKYVLGEREDGTVDELGPHVLIEIHNVGNVPVQGSAVGFEGKAHWHRLGMKHGAFLKNPPAVDGGAWPRRLDPWTSCILKANYDNIVELLDQDPRFRFARRAWVSSLVGDIFRSSRKDMRTFTKALRKTHAEHSE